MLVVSDASPVNILIRVGQINGPGLFESVVVPPSVLSEMSQPSTPESVRDWTANPPAWFSVRAPSTSAPRSELRHRGERDAIDLALEIQANAILLDEEKPRVHARSLGIAVIGTIGVPERAADQGLIIDLRAVHDILRKTNFRVSDKILDASLARHLSQRRP